MAEPGIDEIKKETALIEAETARINAEVARLNAERARSEAQKPPDPTLKDLQAQTGIANAQKDLSNALTNAKIADLFGDVKAGPFSGSVDMKDKAGTLEAMLFAHKAIQKAAEKIGKSIEQTVAADETVLVIPARSFESFRRLTAFNLRFKLVGDALAAAEPPSGQGAAEVGSGDSRVGTSESVARGAGEAATPAMIGAGLDAMNKLLGFFKTDFTFGGAEVTVDEAAAVFALSGAMRKLTPSPTVRLPGVLMPQDQQIASQDIGTRISTMAAQRNQLARLVNSATTEAEKLEIQATNEAGDAKKKTLARVKQLRDSVDAMKSAIAMFDALVAALITPDASGNTLVATLVNDWALQALVTKAKSKVLLVRLEATGGGYLIKKNVWTGLGAAAPLYHMGGAAMSFMLCDGPTGNVLAADTVPVHGGYTASRNVQRDL
jgi:hypothetical protein